MMNQSLAAFALSSFACIALIACSGQTAEAPAPETTAAAAATEQPAPPPAAAPAKPSGPPVWGYEIVATYPHGTGRFTQGLFVNDGVLYETTGQIGESLLIRHDIVGNAEHAEIALPSTVFGEGSVAVGDKIISLTWRAGVGHIHDLETLAQVGDFPLRGEGWGLTYDGKRLIVSDGTDRLRFLDPATFEETGSVAVSLGNRAVTRLNELEYINGEVWANVWQTDVIVRIDPATGNVKGFINLKGLHRDNIQPANNVLNGIAYDAEADRLFVTGKRWPKIFEIQLIKGE